MKQITKIMVVALFTFSLTNLKAFEGPCPACKEISYEPVGNTSHCYYPSLMVCEDTSVVFTCAEDPEETSIALDIIDAETGEDIDKLTMSVHQCIDGPTLCGNAW